MELPEGWNNMETFKIKKEGNTEYLPPLPPNLRDLTIENNELRELPALPASLVTLHIEGNNVTTLPPLPVNITHFSAKNNNLETITGPFPPRLTRFHVTHNELTQVPSLENTEVESVGLGFNNLTALPRFPETLRNLGCPNNQITEIRNLPTNTRVINCNNNPLRVLDIENLTHLRTLIANNCNLTEIPLLPEGPNIPPYNFYLDGNPLSDDFSELYAEYKNGSIEYDQFREAVLELHRDLIQQRKANVEAIQKTLKAPLTAESAAKKPATAAMRGDMNPLNLVAEFITGKKGTLESQKLGLVANEERVGLRDPGAAAAARERIADVAVQGGPMAEKAKLYVKPEDLAAARARQVVAENPEEEEIVNALQGGSKRKHRTPRNRKSSRHTRKH
jgi:hypothetical protein